MTARYTQADYGQALLSLRPRGRAWPDDLTSVQAQVLTAAGGSFARSDAAAQDLLVDAVPASSTGLLGQWEATLGLPDPLLGPGATLAARQAQAVARLTMVGGQSRAAFTGFAAALGFTITISTYAPFRCGRGVCGGQLGGPEWSYAWGVKVLANAQGLPPGTLLAELQAIKPAETTVFLTS